MNAQNPIVVCPERILKGLCEDMKFVSATSIYSSIEERIAALEALYTTHMYVEGEFSAEKNILGGDELLFSGTVCHRKHSVRIC